MKFHLRYLNTTTNPAIRYMTTATAYLGLGSNQGKRFETISAALNKLSSHPSITLSNTSYLYETPPMYLTGQSSFLNACVELKCNADMNAHQLLTEVKSIEAELGRVAKQGDDGYVRNGPRNIDIDILFYEHHTLQSDILEIPHPRIQERRFVLQPLNDISADIVHPTLNITVGRLLHDLSCCPDDVVRVLPLPRDRLLKLNETVIMGILNTTPDSFSDGGVLYSGSNSMCDDAVQKAVEMVEDGADIIDVGGESTRPGAKEVKIEEELKRTLPVIQKLRQVSDIPISIDTRHSEVARRAVESGADIVNDVSGGSFDENMIKTVAELNVPMVIMHMRGTPETMQSMTKYDDVVSDVVSSLNKSSARARDHGIHKFMQILDPGVGFAKDFDGNLSLIKNLNRVRKMTNDSALLLGASRKGFIGKITGAEIASDRDYGTAATSSIVAYGGGSNILRVHNVKGNKQAVMVADALRISR